MKRPFILVAFLLQVLVLSADEGKLSEGYWQIASSHGMAVSYLGAFENEAGLYLEKPDASNTAQAWSLIPLGDGEFNIAKPDTYKSIDNNDTGNPHGNAVIQWSTTIGNPNQIWVFEHLGGDGYAIRSRNTGMYLSYIGDGTEGSPVCQLLSDNSQGRTHWMLKRVEVSLDVEVIRTSSSEDWENERVFAVNKEKGRATFTPYPSVEAMLADSSYCRQWFRPDRSWQRIYRSYG